MNIVLNGSPAYIKEETLVAALVELGYANTIIATAINGNFVPTSQREHVILSDGDQLEIVAPMQGG